MEALERHITQMNITTWMALQVSRRAESCPRKVIGGGYRLREAASRVRLYPWGLGVTFPPIRAESDALGGIGPHHGQGHPALYD